MSDTILIFWVETRVGTICWVIRRSYNSTEHVTRSREPGECAHLSASPGSSFPDLSSSQSAVSHARKITRDTAHLLTEVYLVLVLVCLLLGLAATVWFRGAFAKLCPEGCVHVLFIERHQRDVRRSDAILAQESIMHGQRLWVARRGDKGIDAVWQKSVPREAINHDFVVS